ncbi:MAG TPA: family 65 glycosyl hydrolase, partial [Micromonosporaceae bacterium]|nr:family 65 glycosyl hydrolase [Micromonosporaceae bacterium]
MITHGAFPVEPWTIRESKLDLDVLAQCESVFALSNGHIGLRANLEEGEPHGLPGTYLNAVHELRPLHYGESIYGDPASSQTVVNVANGKVIRLLVDDEPFDVRYGSLEHHERVLDMRAGTLSRHAMWTSPAGRQIEVRTTRMVSFTERAMAAMCYEVTPVDGRVQVVLQSDLVVNEPMPERPNDPRASGSIDAPFVPELNGSTRLRAVMVHSTRRSGLRVGAGMDHIIEGPPDLQTETVSHPMLGRVTVTVALDPGQTLRITKFLAYGWSAQRSLPAIEAQVEAALTAAVAIGWAGLLRKQRDFLDVYWSRADVHIDGDDDVQQAVRFGLFHVLQATCRAERRAIPAKGLTGPGYDGHSFWDTETFVLPVVTYTWPEAARDALRWRHSTLDIAREHAADMGLRGAAFAWRTIVGQECSAYWPAGVAAFHINADIAYAVIRQVEATGDVDFERDVGLELLVETARLWMSLGDVDAAGLFRIDGVTGPDEYSALADNNVYTNLMAQRNLDGAANAAIRHPDVADRLGVTADEITGWRDAAKHMTIPYDEVAGIHPQAEGFTEHAVWDFASTPPENYPLLLHYSYRELYRKQVVKQADLVLAMHTRGDMFTPDQKARNFAYYEAITVRDSSLSAATQAVIAAEVGQLELAYDYLGEAALMDLADLEHNTRDGVHMASLAGAWIALVAG